MYPSRLNAVVKTPFCLAQLLYRESSVAYGVPRTSFTLQLRNIFFGISFVVVVLRGNHEKQHLIFGVPTL